MSTIIPRPLPRKSQIMKELLQPDFGFISGEDSILTPPTLGKSSKSYKEDIPAKPLISAASKLMKQ